MQNPVHVYAGAVSFAVNLTAANTAGTGSMSRANYGTVNLLPPPQPFQQAPVPDTIPFRAPSPM